MSANIQPRRAHPRLAAILWSAGILLGILVPGGGLVVALAAVLTTYRTSSRGVRIALVCVGILTVLYQAGMWGVFGTSTVVGPAHQVN